MKRYGIDIRPHALCVRGRQFVPLLMWQDKTHLIRTAHLLEFVYEDKGTCGEQRSSCPPPPLGKFTEDTLGQHQLRTIVDQGMDVHATYGTYILDQGAAVIYHLSGRKVQVNSTGCVGPANTNDTYAMLGSSTTTTCATSTSTDVSSGEEPRVRFVQNVARSAACSAPDAPAPNQQGGKGSVGFARGAETWTAEVEIAGGLTLGPVKPRDQPSTTHKFKGRCFRCGRKGHSKTFCLDLTGTGTSSPDPGESPLPTSGQGHAKHPPA